MSCSVWLNAFPTVFFFCHLAILGISILGNYISLEFLVSVCRAVCVM